MKKIVLLLIFLALITTGCAFKNINNMSLDQLIKITMNSKTAKDNIALKGYKLYLPNGMTMIDDSNNNSVLYSDGERYYLYVDLVSYYSKKENEYKVNTDKKSFFSQIINYDEKDGYILITKYDNKYFVEVMYNYGKIEVITHNYKKAVTNSLMILKSIKFNDKIIDTLIGTNVLKYDAEEFNLLGPSKETIDFLQEYDDVNNEFDFEKEEEIEISD